MLCYFFLSGLTVYNSSTLIFYLSMYISLCLGNDWSSWISWHTWHTSKYVVCMQIFELKFIDLWSAYNLFSAFLLHFSNKLPKSKKFLCPSELFLQRQYCTLSIKHFLVSLLFLMIHLKTLFKMNSKNTKLKHLLMVYWLLPTHVIYLHILLQ